MAFPGCGIGSSNYRISLIYGYQYTIGDRDNIFIRCFPMTCLCNVNSIIDRLDSMGNAGWCHGQRGFRQNQNILLGFPVQRNLDRFCSAAHREILPVLLSIRYGEDAIYSIRQIKYRFTVFVGYGDAARNGIPIFIQQQHIDHHAPILKQVDHRILHRLPGLRKNCNRRFIRFVRALCKTPIHIVHREEDIRHFALQFSQRPLIFPEVTEYFYLQCQGRNLIYLSLKANRTCMYLTAGGGGYTLPFVGSRYFKTSSSADGQVKCLPANHRNAQLRFDPDKQFPGELHFAFHRGRSADIRPSAQITVVSLPHGTLPLDLVGYASGGFHHKTGIDMGKYACTQRDIKFSHRELA